MGFTMQNVKAIGMEDINVQEMGFAFSSHVPPQPLHLRYMNIIIDVAV